jgi:hypothetical protein|nr:hypothetical protein [Neorhizobium tomejilense]
MKAVLSHIKSFIAETAVAAMSAMTMYGLIAAAGTVLGVDARLTALLALIFVIPFAAVILAMKTVFPATPGHRSYGLWAYIALSQLIAAMFAAAMLEVVGECWDCRGNAHDIVFYAFALGTPYGFVYAFFSKMFSLDVDTYTPAV